MTWRLHVERWGNSGPVALLLPGVVASGRYWRWVAEKLRGQVRVVAPDLLGFGRSPWPDADYRLDDHIDALEATFLAEGLQGAEMAPLLGGHSLGAILALAWAGRRPERFGGLVLMSLPAYPSPREARRHVAALGPLEYLTVTQPRLARLVCGTMCRFARSRFGDPFWRFAAPLLFSYGPAEIARDGVLHTWRSCSLTLRNCMLDVDAQALATRAAATGLPVRVLHGRLDREAPLDQVMRVVERTSWPLQVLEQATHRLPIKHAHECAQAVRSLALEVGSWRGSRPIADAGGPG